MNRKPAALLALALLLPACTPEPTTTGESPVPPAAAVKSRGVSTNSGITTIDLGVLPAGQWSAAEAINQQGTIVGESADFSGFVHLVRWKRGGTIEDLGTFGGGNTWGSAIDDAEEIVGQYAAPGASSHAFYWNQATGFQALPEGGFSHSAATGVARINNGTVTRIVGCVGSRVALWTQSGAGFTLSTPSLPAGWVSGCASAVNPRGDYVGQAANGTCSIVPFRRAGGGGSFAQLPASSPCGVAYGQSNTPYRIVGEAGGDAVMWPTPSSLPIVLAPQYGLPFGVNNLTQVVGILATGPGLPFYWDSNIGVLQLPGLGSATGGGAASALNDAGEVVGFSDDALGVGRATLWLPHDTAQVIIVKQLPFDTTTHLPPKVSYIPKAFINDGILSRPGFDATQLDPNFITLGDGIGHVTAIARTVTGAPKAVPQDVNGDGVLDLKVSFSKAQLIADGVLTRTSYQFEISYVEVTGLQVKAHYPIWVK